MKLGIAILLAIVLAAQASGNGADDASIDASSPAPFTYRSRATSVDAKPSYRNETIPLLEATPDDEVDRMLRKDCESGSFRLDLTTDSYPFETSWVLQRRKDDGGWRQIEAGPPSGRNYGPKKRYVGIYCLVPGEYRFAILDTYKDGICCAYGEGSYAGYIDGVTQFSDEGSSSWGQRRHRFTISAPQSKAAVESAEPDMTDRDRQWLRSHNLRRKEWHERYNEDYVPLEWSNSLKESSQVWADHLLDSCGKGMYHDPGNEYGENLAGNSGTGSWGALRSTDKILYRWVEREAEHEYPKNGHLTQVLWRATKYVGCAEASKPKEGGGMCHVQTCRYARPGNCNMNRNRFRGDGEWWLEPMLMDESPCGPSCPPDGC